MTRCRLRGLPLGEGEVLPAGALDGEPPDENASARSVPATKA